MYINYRPGRGKTSPSRFHCFLLIQGHNLCLQHLQAPLELSKTKARSVRLKAAKFCIINSYLYWKDLGSILLYCLLEEEARKKIKEFHSEDCGGQLYWKTIAHKILRDGFYWPTLFADTYKQVSTYHEFQVFEGKRKL
jgi:hypothetical protein